MYGVLFGDVFYITLSSSIRLLNQATGYILHDIAEILKLLSSSLTLLHKQ